MSQAGDRCMPHTLAQEGPFRVQRCAHCDTLAVHVGAITLRFEAATLESLWNVVGRALLQLSRRAHESHTPLRAAARIGQA